MNSYYGNFRQRTFADVWSKAEDFLADYQESGLYRADINAYLTDMSVDTLYYLLYSEYGNSVIASSDENQFKYQIFGTIFKYGPTWQRQLEIQGKLRSLTDEEITTGNKQIFNKAMNPGTQPTTEELSFVSEQTVAKNKRGALDGYAILLDLLKTDVTAQFISHFKKYFLQIVIPEKPLWFENDINEEV